MNIKKDILLLHGAIGAKDMFNEIEKTWSPHYNIHLLNFSGHGATKIPEEDFSITMFENDVLNYISENNLKQPAVFGYSMGGYVALSLASKYADLFSKVITLATKFNWTIESSEKESKLLNPDKISEKLPAFASALEKRHGSPDWKKVLHKTSLMMIALGASPVLSSEVLARITCPVMLMVGDKDAMVSIEETFKVFKSVGNSCLFVVPDTQHPLEKLDVNKISDNVIRFINS